MASSSAIGSISSLYLDPTCRPESVQSKVDSSFEELASQETGKWFFNGREGYGVCGIREQDVLKQIILENPERSDFYAIDIGAGNFQWGADINLHFNYVVGTSRQLTIHIISVRGESHNGGKPEVYQEGICKVYNIGAFKVEEFAAELKKHGLDLGGVGADLIVSNWCFRHLTDPVGTLLQCCSALRVGGVFAFTTFFFTVIGSNSSAGEELLKVLVEMQMPFLARRTQSSGERSYDCVLRKTETAACQLKMEYADVDHASRLAYDTFAGVVTRFKRDSLFPAVKPAHLRAELYGDRELYLWLRTHKLIESPRWAPLLLQKDGSEWEPVGTQKSGFPQRDLIQTASLEAFTASAENKNINDIDEQGNTALHLAIQEKRWDIAKWLLSNGARADLVSYMDDDGEEITALNEAIRYDESGELVALMIQNAYSRYELEKAIEIAVACKNAAAEQLLRGLSADLLERTG